MSQQGRNVHSPHLQEKARIVVVLLRGHLEAKRDASEVGVRMLSLPLPAPPLADSWWPLSSHLLQGASPACCVPALSSSSPEPPLTESLVPLCPGTSRVWNTVHLIEPTARSSCCRLGVSEAKEGGGPLQSCLLVLSLLPPRGMGKVALIALLPGLAGTPPMVGVPGCIFNPSSLQEGDEGLQGQPCSGLAFGVHTSNPAQWECLLFFCLSISCLFL